MVKLGYELAGGTPNLEILKIGAALEILHAALLIHDDIADQSLTRRDQPSLYQAFGGDHYGISQAINIGDIALLLPVRIITESSFLGEYKLKALSYLSRIIINTGWGQVLDVEMTQKGTDVTEEDINFININKTAKYTIAGPLQIGAILSGAEEKLISSLGEFGENLGIAYQIKDDILDGEVKLERVDKKVIEYADKARSVIPQLKNSKLLNEMVDYMVERTK